MAVGALYLVSTAVVALGDLVAGTAHGVEICVGFKMTARAGHLEVLAHVLVPMLCVRVPGRGHHVPCCAWVVAAGTIVIAPIGVTRLVAVGADVVQALEIGILVTLETGNLTMPAR